MKANECIAWLTGYHDLSLMDEGLSKDQLDCVKKHIKLCQQTEKKLKTKTNFESQFIDWLDGYLADKESLTFDNRIFLFKKRSEVTHKIYGITIYEEFIYWLQGYIEISLSHKDTKNLTLDMVQIKLIKNYIQELGIRKNVGPIILHTVHWIDGFLSTTSVELSAENCGILVEKLNNIFEHVIDVSYGLSDEDNQELSQIHNGPPVFQRLPHSGGDAIYRC